MKKSTVLRSLALAAAVLLGAGAAFAQAFPAKPVNLMVPYPAGGPSDAIARIFNAQLGKELGQQVLVENLGGVSGAMAAQKVLAAPADGYYVFQGSPNEVILSPLANAGVPGTAEDLPSDRSGLLGRRGMIERPPGPGRKEPWLKRLYTHVFPVSS